MSFYTRDKLVFAHRGGARLAPENTLPAFANGIACGSDGLECDVHLSRDGVPVVIHDETVDRTTNGIGPVAELTADELWRLDAGYHFAAPDGSRPFRGRGVGVPPLELVLTEFRDVRVIVEMKDGTPMLAQKVIEVLHRVSAIDRVCVGSFHRVSVAAVRATDPRVTTSASENEVRRTLYRSWCRWPIGAERPYCAFQVPEHAGRLRVVSPSFVAQAHQDRARVDVWVVDAASDIERLFAWGVDGVITDRPDVAVTVRDRWRLR